SFLSLIDGDLTLHMVSDEFAALVGWRARDMIGEQGWEFVEQPSDEFERDEYLIGQRERLLETGRLTGVSRLLNRDGSRPRCAWSVEQLNGGGLYACTGELLSASSPLTIVHAELDADPWMSKAEAAVYANVSESTIERAVRDRRLEAGGTPRKRLFRRRW